MKLKKVEFKDLTEGLYIRVVTQDGNNHMTAVSVVGEPPFLKAHEWIFGDYSCLNNTQLFYASSVEYYCIENQEASEASESLSSSDTNKCPDAPLMDTNFPL